MPKFINKQGTVATGAGGIIYTPTADYYSNVSTLHIVNTTGAAFHLTLSIFSAADSLLTEVYTMILDAGDFINQNNIGQINFGDYIHASTNVGNVKYVLTALEIELPPIPV